LIILFVFFEQLFNRPRLRSIYVACCLFWNKKRR